MRRSSKRHLLARLTGELRTAPTARDAARVLCEASMVAIPHMWLHEALGDEPPSGYIFDRGSGRYMRALSAGSAPAAVIAGSLADRASAAYAALAGSFKTAADERVGITLTAIPRAKRIGAGAVDGALQDAVNLADRVEVLRRAASVHVAVLAGASADGQWTQLPRGKLGAAETADMLRAPLAGAGQPLEHEVDTATWLSCTSPDDHDWGLRFILRHEPVATIAHPGVPVSVGPSSVRTEAVRWFDVSQQTVFAVESAAADITADPDLLDMVHAASGEGAADTIVPVAGFVVVGHTIELPTGIRG